MKYIFLMEVEFFGSLNSFQVLLSGYLFFDEGKFEVFSTIHQHFNFFKFLFNKRL